MVVLCVLLFVEEVSTTEGDVGSIDIETLDSAETKRNQNNTKRHTYTHTKYTLLTRHVRFRFSSGSSLEEILRYTTTITIYCPHTFMDNILTGLYVDQQSK